MKATVAYAHPDGTTQPMTITGPYVVTQHWDGGRALVTVYDRKGRKLRAVHFTHASVIDCDRRRKRRG